MLAALLVVFSAQLALAVPTPLNDTQTNPPGDIPDTQAFVRYTSPAGYSVLVPEGWSRTLQRSSATFVSNFEGERVLVASRSPDAALRGLGTRMSAVKTSVIDVGGARVPQLRFTIDSPSDPVTGKTIRLDGEAYVFVHGPREVVLYLWAPQGSDNVDQWKRIAQSFRWR
jgi:hypothetical protein